MNTPVVSALAWERMVTAVEKVRDRLRRAVQALEKAGIPYAVAGGNAVAAWLSEVDEAAVRNTQDVGILLRRHTSASAYFCVGMTSTPPKMPLQQQALSSATHRAETCFSMA